ncbi:hypothetical protein DEU56DRAFT_735573 [Suillus clintonianus]|uniref:uncharacterized protein n=1 Tax=Suillus clintonianus TaxID=1904413 RepID=UPI001B867B64|nr:uncharacterized protein DEU56DRAFT_735573 [Suillus clintonianus]KAG1718337.1 hypothetical protein EDB19DRAFT_1650632 [Suillus lakei]KAG1718861.1 hypothetical protein EDB19DRAFT_1649331 [Suillus lakei]KAG1733509.1 hypothetical protein EDB19DRAFT_1639628 [Suillus lakei]KAG2139740.1 hypothetical protein DEU56DRAFT_735573 [Suillus clintonianus]
MPLTNDEIAALTKDIAATNIPTIPELPTPPARTPSPQPSPTEAVDIAATYIPTIPELPTPSARTPSPQPSPTEAEVPDTIVEIPESIREANTSSWAARNPTRAIIRPRTPPPRLTDAQKASRKIKRDQRLERTKNLHDAVAEYLNAQKTKIEALSRAHHVTPKHINDIIGSQTHYRTSRKNRPAGSRYSLAELREMVAADPETKGLTRQEKEGYIAALEEHRQKKVVSVRANNLAAARDVVATTDRIVKELDDLRVRTGVYGTLFVVRGHINDTIQSAMHGTDNSEDFWEDVYEHPMADFLRQYEQWACTQNQIAVTGKKDIVMNYNNYETSVIETYGVRLVGWPHGVKFTSPSNIGTVGDIRKLRDALKARTCYWTVLSPAEVKAHASELDTRRSAGEVVRKPRKKRSDAGVPRKRKDGSSAGRANKENHRPLKRAKKNPAQLQEGPKSAEFVESSDEEEGDE